MLGLHTKKTLFIFDRPDLISVRADLIRPPLVLLASAGRTSQSTAANCPYSPAFFRNIDAKRLCDELNNTTGGLDLLLGVTADVAGTDNDGDLGETALSEDLGETERKEVDDGGDIGLLAAQVGITLLSGDEGPEL